MSQIAYLDICRYKRPFDDGSNERIRREAEAVAAILDQVRAGRFELVRSPAHDFENDRNTREDRRLATRLWLDGATVEVRTDQTAADRARALAAMGFGPLDALHLAFAEASGSRWFVTTDDQLLKNAMRHREKLLVEVVNPEQLPLEGDQT